MTSLVIDIGNTLTKIAIFSDAELVRVEQYALPQAAHLESFLNDGIIDAVIISSVRKDDEEWLSAIKNYPLTRFGSDVQTGIKNHYKTPHTLGPDRLAAVTAAYHMYPGMANIVIGGGTTITYDYVDSGGNYFGGSISPGLKMRYKALNYFTGALPLVEADTTFNDSFGNDTTTAIISGVQNGIKYELAGFINSYIKADQGYNVILSGGDSIFFDTLLKNSIFAPHIKIEPYLVLKGLNAAIQQA